MTDVQLGRTPDLHPDAITRVGAEALEAFVLAQLRRLTDRPGLSLTDVPALVQRIELHPSATHLVLDRSAAVGDQHPDLALQDLDARLVEEERMVLESGGAALRIALPQRMKLRGGRSWTSLAGSAPQKSKVDPTLLDALQRAHLFALHPDDVGQSDYRRRLQRLAFLSPAVQRTILEGRVPAGLSVIEMLRSPPPMRWSEQGAWLASLCGG